MDLEEFKTEIRDLIRNAKSRHAAEKLLLACKPNSSIYRTIEVCLNRIETLDKEKMVYLADREYMQGAVYEEYRVSRNKVTYALLKVLRDLSPDELASN